MELQTRLRPFQSDPSGGNFGLQHFTYDNNILLENIFGHLSATSFNGILVCVSGRKYECYSPIFIQIL